MKTVAESRHELADVALGGVAGAGVARPTRFTRLVRGSAWGLVDQAVISAANFLTMVLLARELTTTAFGSFVLAYTALLIANGLQGAVVTQPHNVLGQARLNRDYATYTRSTAVIQGAFAATLALAAVVAGGVAAAVGGSLANLFFALAPAALAWQLQEFTRRVLYTESRLAGAVVSDVLAYGGQVVVLVVLATADRLSAVSALLAVAASSTAGAAYGVVVLRDHLRGRFDPAVVRENWSFGKWLAAAQVISWPTGPLYFYIVAGVLGSAGAAVLKAAQVVLGPLNAFLLFVQTILPVRFSAARERGGDRAVRRQLALAYLLTSPVVVAYAALVAVLADPILEALYSDAYAGYGSVVVAFSAYYVVLHSVVLLTSALASERSTRAIFRGNVAAAAIGLPIGWLLIEATGVRGAVFGMIASTIVLTLALTRAYVPRRREGAG